MAELTHEATTMMLKYLQRQVDDEVITKEYDLNFIKSCRIRIQNKQDLTDKMQNYLYTLYHEIY